ncbi:MAG: hypothetical protein MRZ84_07295 [Eubacterium sp.]|nr:hypothetical protein [Eubacterium sp.]
MAGVYQSVYRAIALPTDNISLANPPSGALVPFDVESQILFSSNYMVPEADQGF